MFMSRSNLLTAVAFAIIGITSSAHAVVIGNWENSSDGWIDWNTGTAIATPRFAYSASGATLGSSALQMTQSGWNQNLAIKLQDNGLINAFTANNTFSIDFTVPADAAAASGWSQIYTLSINAQGYGWHDQGTTPKFAFGYPNGGTQTATVSWDYSAVLASLPANSTFVELILTSNSDGTHNTFYFDNARLTSVPEPATLGVAGATLLGFVIRFRRRSN